MADDDLFDDPTDDTDDNRTIRELRARIKELEGSEKRLKKLEPELNELRTFKAEQEGRVRVSSAEKAFEAAGLPTGLADLFAEKHEGDITEDAVKAWAEQRGLTPAPKETPTEQPQPQPVVGGFEFTPTVQGAPPAPQKMTALDAIAQFSGNPQALAEAVRNGRIEAEPLSNPT